MKNESPIITIVTPNLNLDNHLEETILSVIEQNYPNLEYIIVDGGSKDNSIEIIKKYEKYLAWWTSEADNGIYDALNKGFRNSQGEIMGWLNSDDILHSGSLEAIADTFMLNPHIYWVQGKPNMINEDGKVIYQRNHTSSKYAFYVKDYLSWRGEFIQQESTYWRRDLWNRAGASLNESYDLAADFELWIRFFRHEKIYNLTRNIGAFRKRKSQLSQEHKAEYFKQANEIIDNEIRQLSFKSCLLIKCLKLTERLPANFNYWINSLIRRYYFRNEFIGEQ